MYVIHCEKNAKLHVKSVLLEWIFKCMNVRVDVDHRGDKCMMVRGLVRLAGVHPVSPQNEL